jgi:hypothetical protein
LAAADAARSATSTLNAGQAFSASGQVPFNSEKPLASQNVRACEKDVKGEEEVNTPQTLDTGSEF